MKNFIAAIGIGAIATFATPAFAQVETATLDAASDAAYLQCSQDPASCAALIQSTAVSIPGLSAEERNYLVGQLANVALKVAAENPIHRDALAAAVAVLATLSTDLVQVAGLEATADLIANGSIEQLALAANAVTVASSN